MQPIRFDALSYWIRGKRTYLNAGEFHYFRVPQKDWRARMRLFKKAGGNVLATYIPWGLHEPREGRFTFGGKPWLELEAFLTLAEAEGLYVMARPGPYIYSETVYDGLPRWLCDDYPALRAKNRQGEDFRRSSISYLHPVFLEKARRWYAQVCPILARHDAEKGGCVAMVQIDNELAGIHVWFSSLDYNRETMGFGRADGRYPRWLATRYPSVKALNREYGTAFKSFAKVEPPPVPAVSGERADVLRAKDYGDFYCATIAEYGATLAGWIREHGLACPLAHNSGSPNMNPLYLEMNRTLKPGGFVLGSDHYYTLNQDWGQNNPTPQYAARAFLSLETLRLAGAPPTIFEMPGGSGSDWPPIGREDALACYLANMALGMKGHNYYIFTGGPNPPGFGTTDDIYDYGASVGADGSVRPLFKAQQAVGAFLRKAPFFPAASRESDFRVLLDWTAARSDQWNRQRKPFTYAPHESWTFLLKGILTTAFCAGLSPACVDGLAGDWLTETGQPLVVPSSSVMAGQVQTNLVRFLKNGGKILIGPVLPCLDERLAPCTILRDFLGVKGESESVPDATFARLPFSGTIYCNSLTRCLKAPAGAVSQGRLTAGSGCPAWLKKTAGGGQALWLGVSWIHAMRYHERLLHGCLKKLGVKPVLTCSNPNLWCTLWTAGNRSLLFVMNLHVSPQEGLIACKPSWSRTVRDLGAIVMPPMTVKTVSLQAVRTAGNPAGA